MFSDLLSREWGGYWFEHNHQISTNKPFEGLNRHTIDQPQPTLVFGERLTVNHIEKPSQGSGGTVERCPLVDICQRL